MNSLIRRAICNKIVFLFPLISFTPPLDRKIVKLESPLDSRSHRVKIWFFLVCICRFNLAAIDAFRNTHATHVSAKIRPSLQEQFMVVAAAVWTRNNSRKAVEIKLALEAAQS